VNTEDLADEEIKVSILSFIFFSTIHECREETRRLLSEIAAPASEELGRGKRDVFCSLCILKIAESELSWEEKEEWMLRILTMVGKILEKGVQRVFFYFMCFLKMTQSTLFYKRIVMIVFPFVRIVT
jgi:hypothetical protein